MKQTEREQVGYREWRVAPELSAHLVCAWTGYGPKLLHRIMRFRRFLQLDAAGGARNLAALALEAGYADHAHLVRDCQELAGLPPGRLLGWPITGA